MLRRIARRLGLRRFRLFARPLGEGAAVTAGGLDLRVVPPGDFAALSREADLDLREDSAAAAHARGDFCAGAYDGATLAGYCWLGFAPLPHLDGVWVRFGPQVAWLYKSYVRPSHRGRGIAPLLYRFADAGCRERGRTTSVICVEAHNAPSIVAAQRAGYGDGGRGAYLRRGGIFLDWYSAPAKQAGVAFFVPK
jgi:GNAT superfamily N-acetyltransferase